MSEEPISQTAVVSQSPKDDVPGTDPVNSVNCASCQAVIDTTGLPSFTRVKCPACGAEVDVPAKFGHFILLKRLGAGGMGTVFLAQDEALGRKVAIKMMQKSLGDDPALFETFRNEAQSAAKLNHPHVAQIYSFGQQKGCPYLEMELVAGNKLDSMISAGIKLDPAFVMRVGLEIAEGLKAAEGVGLFHGDIKPDNILFDENMHAKLVDFGIASLASQGKSNELWGTPYYIAPEKVQKKKNSARSDIYSLGATLYHAIAGEPPYEGEDAVAVIKARFKGPPKPLEEIRPEVEPEVSRIIGRMMYNDLFMRYPNYLSVINDIKNYLAAIPAVRKHGPILTQSLSRKTISEPVSPTGEVLSSGEPTPAKPGKKFVIQKGSMDAQAALAAAQSSSSPSIHVVKRPDQETTADKEKGAGNGLKFALIGICAFFILVVLGGVGWLVSTMVKRSSETKASQAKVLEAKSIEEKYFALDTEIQSCLTRMQQRDKDMTNTLTSLDEIFIKATGSKAVVPDLEPPPPPPPEETAPAPEPALAPTKAAPSAVGATNAPAAVVSTVDPELEILARIELKKLGEEKPSSEMINLMIKKVKKEKEEAAAATPAEPAPVAEPAAAVEPAPAAEPVVAPEAPAAEASPVVAEKPSGSAVLQASADKRIFGQAKSIRAALRRCEAIAATEPEMFVEIKSGATPAQAADAYHKRQTAYETRMKLIEEMNGLISAADESLKAMKLAIVQIGKDAQLLITERQRLENENAAAAEKAKVEEEARIKIAKEKAISDDEVSRVQEVLRSKKALIDAYAYDRIIVEMQRMEKELATQAGKDELKWTIMRFKRLGDLRKFLIEDLKKNGTLRRGYRNFDIRGISPDGKEVVVAGRQGITIQSLNLADWMRLISLLLESRPYDRQVGTVEMGDQLFNAAIFCYVHGEGVDAAMAKARKLATLALEKRTSLRADAPKLIPLLAEEAPKPEAQE